MPYYVNEPEKCCVSLGQVLGFEPKWDKFAIKKVIFHDPATVILWKDGTKTVVKCQPGDIYDQEKGFLLAVCKRAYGDTGKYNNIIHRHLNLPSVEVKKENKIPSVETMRKLLDAFCSAKSCLFCPLSSPVCRCGCGTHFLSKNDNGEYSMSDGEIINAYRIAFGSMRGNNK